MTCGGFPGVAKVRTGLRFSTCRHPFGTVIFPVGDLCCGPVFFYIIEFTVFPGRDSIDY